MRQLALMFITFSLLLLSSCDNTSKKDPERQSLLEVSKQELATAVEERDQLMELVKLISDDMEQIRRLENILTVSDTQTAENPRQRTQLLADMAAIKKTLQQRRVRLADLEGRLQNSALYSEALQGAIDALRGQLEHQSLEMDSLRRQLTAANEHIGSLNDTVDSLNNTVIAVTDEKVAAETAATELATELNTCYYVIATKSQLKAHNILETGFLRKSQLMKGDFDKGFFTVNDKRNIQTLPLNSQKAKLLTNHPEKSFEIIVDSNNQKALHILDKEEFWSLSNYLVIQID